MSSIRCPHCGIANFADGGSCRRCGEFLPAPRAAIAGLPKNPHTFLTNIGNEAAAPLAFAAQKQIATFFFSRGTVVIDPDAAGSLFEVPIAGPLPETLSFIP